MSLLTPKMILRGFKEHRNTKRSQFKTCITSFIRNRWFSSLISEKVSPTFLARLDLWMGRRAGEWRVWREFLRWLPSGIVGHQEGMLVWLPQTGQARDD